MDDVPERHRAFAEVVAASKLKDLKDARDREDWLAVAGLIDWLAAGAD